MIPRTGGTLPAGYAESAGDCNDADLAAQGYWLGYVDADGDGFGAGALLQVCSGATLRSGQWDGSDEELLLVVL